MDTRFTNFTKVASIGAAVASGIALTAIAIESIPVLGAAGIVAFASGVVALGAGNPHPQSSTKPEPGKIESWR